MRLSILIRNFNEADFLRKTLLTIQKQKTGFPYEIVVSDNNSTDKSVEVAQSFGCRVVHNTATSFSYGQLLNFGIQHCQGEFVLLMSAHVALLNDNAIESMLAPMTDKNVACVSATPASMYMLLEGLEPRYYSVANVAEIDQWKNWKKYEPFLFGAPCGVLRKSAWEHVKFDESLEITEDRHWNLDILRAGYKSVYGVDAYFLYFKERTTSTNRKRAYLESLVMHKKYGQAETVPSFYTRNIKTLFSQAYHNLINLPLGLWSLLRIYMIRFKRQE